MADQVITKQELIDAQKDAQTLEDAVNGEPGKLIKSRTGREFYSLASVPQINTMTREEIDTAVASRAPQSSTYTKIEVDSALSTKAPQSNTYTKAEVDTTFAAYVGGRKAFTTLALAQAGQSTLTANTVVDVTNDPDPVKNGTYQWNGTTLTKSAYDPKTQAINYVNENIKSGSILLDIEYYNDFFINTSGGSLEAKGGYNNVKTAIIPVQPNTTYYLSNFYAKSDGIFDIFESNSKNTTIGFVVKRAKQNINIDKSGSVTTSALTNYLYLNVNFGAYSNADFSISLASGASIFGNPVLSKLEISSKVSDGVSTNLHSTATIYDGAAVLINEDELVRVDPYSVARLKVESNKKYTFFCDDYSVNSFALAFRPNDALGAVHVFNKITSSNMVLNKDGSFDFTVPEGMQYVLYNVKNGDPNDSFDISGSTIINEIGVSIESVVKISDKPVCDEFARRLIKDIQDNPKSSKDLKSKRWLAIGDSITDSTFQPYVGYKNYLNFVQDRNAGLKIYNYGQSGSGFYNRYNSLYQITQSESEIDFITVFLGTNDWVSAPVPNEYPLGQFGDKTADTVAGKIYLMFDALINKFPNTPIFIITPLPRATAWGDSPALAPHGYQLNQIVDMLIRYANHYSFAHLDWYRMSNFRIHNQAMIDAWTCNSDGLHPNNFGHEHLSHSIESFILTNI